MALVDHQGVLLALKDAITHGKRSWGSDELTALVARLEAEHRVDEDEVARYSRLLSAEVEDLIFHRALAPDRAGGTGEGRQPAPDRASPRGRAAGMAEATRPSRAPEAPDEEAPCRTQSRSLTASSPAPVPT